MTSALPRRAEGLGEVLAHIRAGGRPRSVHCPAHDDQHESLSVGIGRAGRALLRCHAGCSYEDIVTAAGLEPDDLFPSRGDSGWTPAGPAIAVYRYEDERGELLF